MFKKGIANDAARADIAIRVAERMAKKAADFGDPEQFGGVVPPEYMHVGSLGDGQYRIFEVMDPGDGEAQYVMYHYDEGLGAGFYENFSDDPDSWDPNDSEVLEDYSQAIPLSRLKLIKEGAM